VVKLAGTANWRATALRRRSGGRAGLFGDAVETATASGLSIELADGAALFLGENTRAIIRGVREDDSRGAIEVALVAGSARVERIDESATYPIVMTGGFATARALSPRAGWIMRTGSRGTDVATILGETMVTHRYHYWRMVLGPDVGMSRIAIGDVHKFRLPKARHFSRAKLEAIFPTAEP
jgi:hypothetical protein